MTTIGNDGGSSSVGRFVLAFAKLQGENFEYYMQKYSIILGRGTRKNSVDLDLRRFGGNLLISRHHARIFYDFNFRCFALEVLGRNGCIIRNAHFMPGNPPIKIDSQDLVQMGEVSFYFLLPSRPFLVSWEAARHVVPPLPPLLVAIPVAYSNDGRDGEERECNREESGIERGEGDVSGLIIEESDARESVHSFDVPSGGALDSAGQIAPTLLPRLVVVPPTADNEMKDEERKGEGEESLASGHGGGLSGMIVEEFKSREAGDSSSEQLGAGESAMQIDVPLTSKLVVIPAYISNEKKGKEKEGDREENQGTGCVEGGVSGLAIEEFNAIEVAVLSNEQPACYKDAMQIESPLMSQFVLVPLESSNDQKNCEESRETEEIAGVKNGEVLNIDDSSAREIEVPSGPFEAAKEAVVLSGEQSGALEAARQIKPPLPSQLMVAPLVSSNYGKNCEEKEGQVEGPGVVHGEGDTRGLIAAEKQDEKLAPRSKSDREADNQEETHDVHAFKEDVPAIKEQIKLEVEHFVCHSARAGDQQT